MKLKNKKLDTLDTLEPENLQEIEYIKVVGIKNELIDLLAENGNNLTSYQIKLVTKAMNNLLNCISDMYDISKLH